jgi:hypothetical protein
LVLVGNGRREEANKNTIISDCELMAPLDNNTNTTKILRRAAFGLSGVGGQLEVAILFSGFDLSSLGQRFPEEQVELTIAEDWLAHIVAEK